MSALEIAAVVFNVVLATVSVYAALCGGSPERWGAMINISGALISVLARLIHGRHWVRFEASTFAIDIMVLMAFVTLARLSSRYWPIWAAGFALAGVSVHVARLTMPGIGFLAYGNAEVGCTYLALLALALATMSRLRARRAGQPDVPWRAGLMLG